MNKLTVCIVLSMCCCQAQAKVVSETLCFSSSDKKPIRFEIRTFFDTDSGWSGGFVRYEKSKKNISLVQKSFESESVDQDRPSQTTQTWLEVIEGKITGQYEMTSEGTNIYSMQYSNYERKRQYSFSYDSNAVVTVKNSCQW